jgi:hypothetical protein
VSRDFEKHRSFEHDEYESCIYGQGSHDYEEYGSCSHAGCFLGLLFDPEPGDVMIIRNTNEILLYYKAFVTSQITVLSLLIQLTNELNLWNMVHLEKLMVSYLERIH